MKNRIVKKSILNGLLLSITLIVLITNMASAAPREKPGFPRISLLVSSRGERAIQLLADKLPDVAAWYGSTPEQFTNMLRGDHTARIDTDGRLFFIDEAPDETDGDDPPSVAEGSYPYEQTFKLHSLPGSKRTIYLDFDGHTTTGTAWNTYFGVGTINSPAYDLDGDASTFNNTEMDIIQNVWKLVAEDYAPFDVDVTTEDPGQDAITRSNPGDVIYGSRIVITVDNFASCGCGGFAYVGVFNYVGDYYKPAFVFNKSLVGVAEAASHEAGHNLGLSHDGITGGTAYYQGHGSGDTGWAPIMGVGYYRELVQWSKGEYANANNTEDDIQIIQNNGALLLADDHGNNLSSATTLVSTTDGNTVTLSGKGIIERRADVDYFRFMTVGGDVSINVVPAQLSPNLDILAELYDSNSNLIANSNPVNILSASINENTLPAGEYFIMVDGAGKGDPQDTGYSDYASLGVYTINGIVSNIVDADGDGYNSDVDCDDSDPDINPGVAEVCDGFDNDCNGQVDEGVTTIYYEDADQDGYGNLSVSQVACSQPAGFVTDNTDCDDADAAEHPGQTWYKDLDNDGYSDGTTDTTSCARPSGFEIEGELTAASGDCDDSNPGINPGAVEVSDGVDNNCNGQLDEGVVLTTYYWLEAESAESIASPMQVANDGAASGGQYIWVPDGYGHNFDGTGEYAEYTVNVTEEGEYVLWGRVIAPTSSDDSFFVKVGDSANKAWSVAIGNNWQWDMVNIKGGVDPVKYYLTTGNQTIRISHREDGTKLDKLLLTNDMDYDPSGTGGNSPPTANDDIDITDEGTPVIINVSGNDTDVDGTINPATVLIVDNPDNGTAVHNGDGTVTYTPSTGYTGTDTFTYTVEDDDGAMSNQATVTVNITGISDPDRYYWLEAELAESIVSPMQVANDGAASGGQYIWVPDGYGHNFDGTGEYVEYTVNVTEEGEYVLWGRVIAPTSSDDSFFVKVGGGANKAWSVAIGNNWQWDMVNIKGGVDPVKYYLTPGAQTIKIGQREDGTKLDMLLLTNDMDYVPTVTGGNSQPVANNDSVTTSEFTPVTIDVAGNDSDTDGTINPATVLIVNNPSNGTAVHNGDGTVTYSPYAGYSGVDTFTYTIEDNDGAVSNLATVTVTVNNVVINQPPEAVDDSDTTDENTPVTINVAGNDTDSDGTIVPATVTIVDNPDNGTAVHNGDGTVTYTPSVNYTGTDTFTYTIDDDEGAKSNDATVTVNITGINDTGRYYWLEGEAAKSITNPMQVLNDGGASGGQYISVPNGQGSNWDGTGGYAEYVVNVTKEGEYILWGRVKAPTSSDDSFFVKVGDSVNNAWSLAKVSSWQWDKVNIKGGADPVKYYLTTGNQTIRIGQREDGAKLDKLLLTNDMDYVPAGTGGNSQPVANNDTVTTSEHTPVTIDVTDNDKDADGTINPATVLIVNNPANGTAVHNGDGTVTYSPYAGYNGVDTFIYTVEDDDGAVSNRVNVIVVIGTGGIYFPLPGEGLDKQIQLSPEETGLDPLIISELQNKAATWALWRHGYLIHVNGNFNAVNDVASLRKTWHALTVGAAIKQGKIPSYNQKINVWQTGLTGNDADATWWHVITQSAGFDYPYGIYPDFEPGEMWTYSDLNLFHLNHALAKAYGRQDFYDNYGDVLKEAYFDAIGMQGWSTKIVYDNASQMEDGIRLELDLEDMGRLGLLVLARGKWNGIEIIPQWFVEELERKQTYGMQVNYNGPNDGILSSFLNPADFPESPYGLMTWVNTDGNYYTGADTGWAFGRGLGYYILWNATHGIVFAGTGVQGDPTSDGIPHIIERNITGSNPLIP